MTGGQLSLTIMCVAVCSLVGWIAYLSGRYHKRKEEEEQ